ncbi:hypothetical protein G3H63_15130 [Microbacterium resistens]|uniref:hypothetical protein n=1 Tax=Microbacterium resistens TaxID=156977 RepID=UPI001C5607B8|nr:hypothetical protein [Microbacterium resistens]MBW1640397.1 hypothetical protein [Microbacterium resistens]
MTRRLTALALVAGAVLGLTGCAGQVAPGAAPDPGATGVSDACAEIGAVLADGSGALQGLMTDAVTDPQGAVDTVRALADRLGAAVTAAGDGDVADAGAAVHGSYLRLTRLVEKAVAENDPSALGGIGDVLTELSANAKAFTDVCTG